MTRLICPEDIDGIETPFMAEMDRLTALDSRPPSHPVATETSRPTGGWYSVTDLDGHGVALQTIDCCPLCWPAHEEQADGRKRVNARPPMQFGITCHHCGVRRAG